MGGGLGFGLHYRDVARGRRIGALPNVRHHTSAGAVVLFEAILKSSSVRIVSDHVHGFGIGICEVARALRLRNQPIFALVSSIA